MMIFSLSIEKLGIAIASLLVFPIVYVLVKEKETSNKKKMSI
ncbi:hypothetical protein ACQKOI_15875 [Bacillus paramycoides]|nr:MULTISPECIES: hypothetical protein [Bacillus cereus group]